MTLAIVSLYLHNDPCRTVTVVENVSQPCINTSVSGWHTLVTVSEFAHQAVVWEHAATLASLPSHLGTRHPAMLPRYQHRNPRSKFVEV